jgi:type II secretory pathway pseudopilin PulG
MKRVRAFSLLEMMVCAALVGLMGAGSLSLTSFLLAKTAEERAHALAVADAQSTLDRIGSLVAVAGAHGGKARFCELLGPLAGGGAVSGTCPTRTVSDIPVPGSKLKRAVNIASFVLDGVNGFQLEVTISGNPLRAPLSLRTVLPIGAT